VTAAPSAFRGTGCAASGGMDWLQHSHKNARILIIDDREASALGLAQIVERAGYAVCLTFTDPALAVERFAKISPDLVLLDLHMEPLSGIDVLRQINAQFAPRSRPPVLVLTADTTPEAKREALGAGATDFLSKPLDTTEVLLRIAHLLEARSLYQQCRVYSEGLERLVEQRTADLQKQTRDLEQTLSELRETQHQVIQQERLRALGTMASGIAHDLNNGLSLILGYGDMLLRDRSKFPPDSKEARYVEEMVNAGLDNAQMVKRLREFYRPCAEREDRQAVDLNQVVEQAVSLTAPRWQAEAEADGVTVRIKKDFGKLPVIAAAPAELREVLTNFIFNAVEAMPRGGRIEFKTRQKRGWVCLEVSDTGKGMTEETRRRCLEPFYTTKGDGGSGLGLAMSYGIIRRHGGTITVESRLNKGSTFTIHLPVPNEPIEPVFSGLEPAVRSLRVLVVDDHAGIREIVSAYLTEDQHTVETACGAREAMEKFQEAKFDLVITDQAMPDINGNELAASIKRIAPMEPVIMLTGFADLLRETGQRSRNVDLVLNKPARREDLRQAIRDVMHCN
jgi:signal transduction histidine kinase